MATEPGEAYRDKPGDCRCRYPWKLFATASEHATDCPAHERICRERGAPALPATPLPVGDRVVVVHGPYAGRAGVVLGVAGAERWVQVDLNGQDRPICVTYRASQLLPEPEPDPADDGAAIATGVAQAQGGARSR
jgi:hypothetical protein